MESGLSKERLPASPRDVNVLYRVLLGREPENERVVKEKTGADLFRLIVEIVESAEFEARVLTFEGTLTAKSWVDTPPNPEDLRWIETGLCMRFDEGDSLVHLLGRLENSVCAEGKAIRPASSLMRMGAEILTQSIRLPAKHKELPNRELVLFSGLWDEAFFLSQLEGQNEPDPLGRFLSEGLLDPHPLFCSSFYLQQNPDVRAAGVNALVHFLRHGDAEDRWPNPLFSPDWYRRFYNLPLHSSTLGHFVIAGASRAAKPHPLFDGDAYIARYADVREARVDPYVHYVRHGAGERRSLPASLDGPNLRIAVVAHVFHSDLWPEMLWYLNRFGLEHKLYVTVPEADSDLRNQIETDRPDARVISVINKGRDLGAFFETWPLLQAEGIDIVCKVHTKKGGTEPDTWRHLLLEGNLGSQVARKVYEQFRQDTFLTLVGPQQLYLDGARWTSRSERDILSELLQVCDASEQQSDSEAWGFFAGSCFWLRLEAFRCVGQLSPVMMDESNAEREGQRAHALERLFGALAARRGDRVGFTDMSGSEALPIVTVRRAPGPSSRDDFPAYLRGRTRDIASAQVHIPHRQRRAWTAPPKTPLGVTFVGPVEAVNGLGVSARGFVRALEAAGVPLTVLPWRLGFDRVRHETYEGAHLGSQPINIVHLNLDLVHTGHLLEQEPLSSLVQDSCFNILIVSWELLSLPPQWTSVLDAFDEVWASSRFMVTGVRSVSRTPVRVVRPALVDPPQANPLDLAPARFLFGYIADTGSLLQRKNPELLWRTYCNTFSPADGGALVVKLHYPEADDPLFKEAQALARSRDDVFLIADSLSDPALASLMSRIDCYVSPHRSEGLGLTILEAMMAGKPVIYTDFGGCTEFADASTAFPIARRLVRVGEGAAPYPADAVWADPLAKSLGEQMKQVFENRAAAAVVAAEGRKRSRSMFSTAVAAEGVRAELRRIWLAGGGSDASFENSLVRKDD